MGYFVADELILSHEIAVDVLLVDILFGRGVFYEELLKVLQFYLKRIVVVANNHIVLL